MLGLTRQQARERFDDIIAFAELEEFVDLKLKNYSSGMHVRLAFSVAIQVDAEVLLIDEVLAVGDAAFQQKCFDEFDRLKRRGPHDRLRHARHGARSSASATARCCWRAASMVDDRRRRPRSRARYHELNFGRTVARARRGRRRGALRRPARRRSSTRGSRTPAASGSPSSSHGEPLPRVPRGALPRADRGPGLRLHAAQRASAHTIVRDAHRLTHGADRAASRPARRVVVRLRVRQLADAEPLPADAVDRPRRAPAPTRSTCARTSRRARRARRAVDRRRRRTCRTTFEVERAMSARADAPTAQPPRARPVGARRRPAPLLAPDLDARAHRVQAALLRLGARLPVAAGAAAAAVRRAVHRLHAGRSRVGKGIPHYSGRTCSARSCCSRSSPRATAAACACLVDRENLLRKISSRGW